MLRLSSFVLALAAGLLIAHQLSGATRELAAAGAAERAVYAPAAGCPTTPLDPAADLAARTPREAPYPVCIDQIAHLDRAIARAAAERRLLVVEFGATWCPWCKVLAAAMSSPEVLRGPEPTTFDLAPQLASVKIAISTLHGGRRTVVPSGEAALRRLLADNQDAAPRAVPFIVVVDPQRPERIVARNTDDMHVLSTGRIDAARLRDVLVAAHDHLRKGTPAPTESSWIRRKLTRFLSSF